MSVADRLPEAFQAAGAACGAVAWRVTDCAPAVRAWGQAPETAVFEAGSVTKTVTGLLLALAIEAGEVSGSDPLARFLPGTGPAGKATLAELATHTSGLPRLPGVTLLRSLAHPRDPYRGASLHRLIRDTSHLRAPIGGAAAYSNLGSCPDPGSAAAGHDRQRGHAEVRSDPARCGVGSGRIRAGWRPAGDGCGPGAAGVGCGAAGGVSIPRRGP
jgi:Beta-lactamase